MNENSFVQRNAVKQLPPEVARKIAAGEVIDRPNAIVRELMDNAVDSGASSITVEITQGGIEKIRVIDNGCGMTKEDLLNCAHPHATSKISSETDLLKLSTLGFRGEALSSMAAVSRLEIKSGEWQMNSSITEDHILTPSSNVNGTIVQTSGLFENFPARRRFLKRPSSEALLCKTTFEEKSLPRPDLAFSLFIDGNQKYNLPSNQSLTERFTQALDLPEDSSLFYELSCTEKDYSFKLVIGEPSVIRDTRKNIYIYVNGRKIQEYSLLQAIEYGCQGYFPNGSHPVAVLFVTIDSSLVDFNIHPAKREARFKDINQLHHSVSTTVRNFFKQYTVKTMVQQAQNLPENETFDFSEEASDSISGNISNQHSSDEISGRQVIDFEDGKNLYVNSGNSNGSRNNLSEAKPNYFSKQTISENTYKDTRRNDWRSQYFGGYQASGFAKAILDPETDSKINSIPAADEFSAEGISGISGISDTSENTEASAILQNRQTPSEKDDFKFIGCALGTFLIAEKNSSLYIIDQHAADERQRFNELTAHSGERQTLLVPYEIQTDNENDDLYLEEISDELEKAGFTVKKCGNGKWEFHTVPVRWKGTQEDLRHDLLDRKINPAEAVRSVLAMTACRASVMDGTVLDDITAEKLARNALLLPDPHCPHGRPVYTVITRSQLFTLVKRT